MVTGSVGTAGVVRPGPVEVLGGTGPTVADLALLAVVAARLDGVAADLRRAAAALDAADRALADPGPPAGWPGGIPSGALAGRATIAAAAAPPRGAAALARSAEALAADLRQVRVSYAAADDGVRRALLALRAQVAAARALLPLDGAGTGRGEAWTALVGGGLPVAAVTVLGQVVGGPGGVPVAAGRLAGLVDGPGGDGVVVRPVVDPPQVPAPRDAAGVLAAVGAVASGWACRPGARAVVGLQRLDHPDGGRAWLLLVPGTVEWRPGTSVPADLTSDLQLVAGRSDPLTAGALAVLAGAGVGPDEPVLLAGHSQGGLVVQAVAGAAAGTYAVRGVLTAGSPDVPRALPPGVPVRHYRHPTDPVPQLDGLPDVVGGDVTVVRRDPGLPASRAHGLGAYVATARAAEALGPDPRTAAVDAALAAVLGPAGTTATTTVVELARPPEDR
ncbi:hypothetical protein [Cellulomonas marina]|uniref:hypothetical protein n=1 Tax=Cellulomonas marina TaxID=988821 RepID=UPI0011132F5F|nr:hypothetical protein [Cellulomonas marina]GIG28726.1 hypothetical protein Cma02nite_13260 [Cellulomonas marina]